MRDFIPPEIWSALSTAFGYVYLVMPIWLPILLAWALFDTWLKYRRQVFWSKQEKILLEIKLPREISKSPAAMEVILGVFYQIGGEATWVDRWWKGQTRPWFSLEIASFGGRVSFFIWSWAKFKNVIESQIYSQYPGLEIYQVPDYTLPVSYDPEKSNIWACEFSLANPDPYPIKTYVDYGLDKDPKEEFKVDPITTMLEFLGSLTDGHEIWYQIIIRAHKKEQVRRFFRDKKKGFTFSETYDDWKDEARKQIDEIIEKLKVKKEEGGFPRIPTKGEAEKIAALERSVSKTPFDCGIRVIYIADKDKFNPANIGGCIGSMMQYNSPELNGFRPKGWFTIFNYPWQDYYGYGRNKDLLRKMVLEQYKMRSFFFSSYKGRKIMSKPFVLNSEELATIYHFPGLVAATPTFERVPSRKAEAPSNLPV